VDLHKNFCSGLVIDPSDIEFRIGQSLCDILGKFDLRDALIEAIEAPCAEQHDLIGCLVQGQLEMLGVFGDPEQSIVQSDNARDHGPQKQGCDDDFNLHEATRFFSAPAICFLSAHALSPVGF
jgi:hypothetical protein